MPISPPSKILASDFNQVVASYEQIWGNLISESGFLWTQADKTLHKFGWGQSAVEPIVVGNVDFIEAEHINRLIAQVNAGLYHLDSTATMLSKYAVASQVTYASMALVMSAIDTITSDKFGLNDQAQIAITHTESASCSWTDSLTIIVKYTFNNYQEARHFFNAGGKLLINMDAIPDIMCPEAQYWESVLAQLGDVLIGAESTTSTGALEYQSRISNFGGFYSISTTGEETKLASMQGYSRDLFAGVGDYTNAYSERVLEIYGSVTDSGAGDFAAFIKIVLTENPGDQNAENNNIIEADFALDAGYIQPTDAPSDAYLADVTGASFKAGAYTYQFQERPAPAISIQQTWTPGA